MNPNQWFFEIGVWAVTLFVALAVAYVEWLVALVDRRPRPA